MPQRSKFIALAEESTWGTAGTVWMYFKLLSESIVSSREDFYPETTEYWVSATYMNGFFRTAGSFDVLVDPIQWPKALVLFIGDGNSAAANATAYTHTFIFGSNEDIATTEVKPFTVLLGVGIEKDRQVISNIIESITLEASAMNPVRSTITVIGSGQETLETPAIAQAAMETGWAEYTQPYLTFTSATVMTVGGVNRLTTAPTIESFQITMSRGWDADHYILGSKFLAAPTQSGFSEVSGTMDFTFTSQDEYERYLNAVGGTAMGDQAPFALVLTLEGAVADGDANYTISLTIPEIRYTASTVNFTGRDRIVQTVEWRALHNAGIDGAIQIDVTNLDTSYATLA